MNKPKSRSGASPARQSGVTLIELIVTVIVIGILAAIAVPSFSNFLDRQRLVGTVQEISGFVKFARVESLKTSESVWLVANRSSDTEWCFGVTDANSVCDCLASGCLVNGVEYNLTHNEFPGVKMLSPTTVINAPSNVIKSEFEPRRGTVDPVIDAQFSNNSGGVLNLTTTLLGNSIICGEAMSYGGYDPC